MTITALKMQSDGMGSIQAVFEKFINNDYLICAVS